MAPALHSVLTMARTKARPPQEDESRVRLQRVMADAGVAARRACEDLIEQGRVTVNGEVVRRLPVFVDPHADRIQVDGRPLRPPERKLYLMVHKPERMLVTTADEPEFDRATITEIVDHPAKARLFPVGRLDFESAGLVIMTNDGDLANALTHPRFNVPKTYEALIKGRVDQALLDGVRVKLRGLRKREAREDGTEGPVSVGPIPEFEFVKLQGANTVVRITLLEARNRELRDVLEFLGMPVKRLVRVGIGGLTLSGVAPARWRELTREEIQLLRRPRGGFVVRPRPVAPAPSAAATPPGAPSAGPRPRPAAPTRDARTRESRDPRDRRVPRESRDPRDRRDRVEPALRDRSRPVTSSGKPAKPGRPGKPTGAAGRRPDNRRPETGRPDNGRPGTRRGPGPRSR